MSVKVGEKYNLLTVIEVLPAGKILCKCDCGKTHIVGSAWHLASGNTKSCGCYHKKVVAKAATRHGLSKHPLYKTWRNMIARCENPRATHHEYYCDKGITVCSEWHKFVKFYDWSISNGWRSGLTIDRIDSNKGYSPDNCRWVDYVIQNNNLASNHLITYKNETHSIYAWARKLGINPKTLGERIRRGWSVERALTQAVEGR